MRTIVNLLLLASLLFVASPLWSQSGNTETITGVVVDQATKQPISHVTVRLAGTSTATQTNDAGAFGIKAKRGQTLEISYVGFEALRVPVTSASLGTVNLRVSAAELQEVTVAMDLKRKPRELGFSTQTVAGRDVQETQRDNFLNGLQGRIAGATITSTSGVPGASSTIVLRGFNSMSLSNQPLFVVDGIIVDNSTLDVVSNVPAAAGQNSTSNDFTNRIADINPNDIESITVLKGPEATVLYGSSASSGAIVITTKKAKLTKGKPLNIYYDNSVRFQALKKFPSIFSNYQQGRNGIAEPGRFEGFGPLYAEGTPLYDNVNSFFRDAWGHTHNLGVEFGLPNSTFRVTGSYYDQQGVVPSTELSRWNFKITNTTKIGKYIDITPSFAYTNSTNDKTLKGVSGYLLNLYLWPANDYAKNYIQDNGGKRFITIFNNPDASETDNPFFAVTHNKSQDKQNRYISTMAININPLKWLTFAGRFGYDHYTTDGFQYRDPQSSSQSSIANKGSLDNYYVKYKGYNHTITATARKSIGDFNGRLTVGTRWNETETQRYGVSGTKDSLRIYDSSGTDPKTRTRLSAAKFGEWNKYQSRQIAGFGEFNLNYKNVVFLTASMAFEAASVLPKANRNYSYPGANMSVILTDIIPGIKGKALSFWKLRGSLAQTARLPDAYQNQSNFVDVSVSSNVAFPYQYAFLNANPNLKPERQKTYELGTELRLLKDRVSIDFAYYNTLCTDQIAQGFRASYGTGFVLNTQNNSSIRNQGIELALTIDPIRKKNFSWNAQFNFNHMWNEVIAIPLPISQSGGDYYDASTWVYANARGGIVQGGTTGTITGFGYARNKFGDIIIDATTGLPTIEQVFKVRGDRTPDFTLGFINKFRYKSFSLSFLWDMKIGGDVFNGTNMYLTTFGKTQKTADRMTPRVVSGVLNDGLQNTDNPTRNTIMVTPYYNYLYYATTAMPEEDYVEHDVNYLRLRDISLYYTLPENFVKSKLKGVQSFSIFATCNDLLLFTNYTGADPATNGGNASLRGVGAVGIDYGNIAVPLSFNFGVKASF
jgi:TonB-linked SusC/RagA family outer membrane protein